MVSTAWYNGVDPLEMSDKLVPKVDQDSWRFFANLDISLYIHLLVDLPRVCVQVFEKISACAARKMHFCTQMWVPTHEHVETGFDNAETYSAGEEKSPYFLFHGEKALCKILRFQGETADISEKFQGEKAEFLRENMELYR